MSVHRPSRSALIGALAIASGFCALGYEVLYVRQLTTLLGDTFYVHAALLGMFLVGVGVGARIAHRVRPWFFLFEIGTGLYALALPSVVGWISLQPFASALTAGGLPTIAASAGLVAVPSFLIGVSLPLFSDLIKAENPDRLAFEWVYTAYNVGAFVGVLAVELLLIRSLGISKGLAFLGVTNILVGILLYLLRPRPVPSHGGRPTSHRFGRGVLGGLAVASAASAAFQMFLVKLTYFVFAPHRENFAVALGVTLLGISLGAMLASRFRIRFETSLLLVPVALVTVFLFHGTIVDLYQAVAVGTRGSDVASLAVKFGFTAVYGLGPMVMFGSLLPALMRSEQAVAQEAGVLLLVSSVANAVGYLAYVLILHPLLAPEMVLISIGGACLVAAAMAGGRPWIGRRWPAVMAAGAALICITLTVSERNMHLARWGDRLQPTDRVTVFKSGPESATLVQSADAEWVTYNGHASIYVSTNGVVNLPEHVSGLVPALAAPRLDRALVLGLGTGTTAGTTAQVFEHTDVVEINGAFIAMLPMLTYANLDIIGNTKAMVHHGDGRTFLNGTDGVYDAIMSSMPNPTYFAASKIYTVEFYQRVRRSLKPDGVFSMWLSATDMSEAGVRVVLSALRGSFEHCDLRFMRRDYYLTTCSNQPIKTRLYSDIGAPYELDRSLQRGIGSMPIQEYIDNMRLADDIFARNPPRSVPRENTDDYPVLEFMVTRHAASRSVAPNIFVVEREAFGINPVGDTSDAARFVRRARLYRTLDPELFDAAFAPVIEADSVLRQAWAGRGG